MSLITISLTQSRVLDSNIQSDLIQNSAPSASFLSAHKKQLSSYFTKYNRFIWCSSWLFLLFLFRLPVPFPWLACHAAGLLYLLSKWVPLVLFNLCPPSSVLCLAPFLFGSTDNRLEGWLTAADNEKPNRWLESHDWTIWGPAHPVSPETWAPAGSSECGGQKTETITALNSDKL